LASFFFFISQELNLYSDLLVVRQEQITENRQQFIRFESSNKIFLFQRNVIEDNSVEEFLRRHGG
jgi:hypothetical protein